MRGLTAIYQAGFNLHKAGVMLLDLQHASVHQHELALTGDAPAASERVMAAMDCLNDRYGRGK